MAVVSKSGGTSTLVPTKNDGKSTGNDYLRNSLTKGRTKAEMNDYVASGGYDSGYDYSGGYGSGGYDSGYQETYDPYAEYLAALQAQRDEAIAKANKLLDEQGKLGEQRYALQQEAAKQDYQDLRNQSEVNRFKARGSLRESLSNRGAMDSGIGRQAYVNLANNYNNALNRIGLQEKREDAERNQAIQEMWNQIAMQKAANEMTGLDMMGSILSQIDPSYLSAYSYSPDTSRNYAAASNVVQRQNPASMLTSGIGNAQYDTGATQAARVTAFDDLLNALRTRNQTGSAYGR